MFTSAQIRNNLFNILTSYKITSKDISSTFINLFKQQIKQYFLLFIQFHTWHKTMECDFKILIRLLSCLMLKYENC